MREGSGQLALALFAGLMLVLFGAYSLAPVFELDELYPRLFQPYGVLSWAMVGLMVLGAVYWTVRTLKEPKDDG